MSYGAEFTNDQGIVVISDNRLVETFVGKATYNSSPGRRSGKVRRYVIYGVTKRPMVFLHTNNGHFASILSVIATGGNGYIIDVVTTGGPSDVEVYCFAQVPGSQTETSWGMNIYDENQNPVFSSNWKILNVRGIVRPPQYGGTVSHGISGLVKPAAMCPCNSGESTRLSDDRRYVEWDDRDVFRVNSTTITTSRVRVWFYNESYWGVGEPPYSYGQQFRVQSANASPFPIIDVAQYD